MVHEEIITQDGNSWAMSIVFAVLQGPQDLGQIVILLQKVSPPWQLFCQWVMSLVVSLFAQQLAVSKCTDHLLPLISLNSSESVQ